MMTRWWPTIVGGPLQGQPVPRVPAGEKSLALTHVAGPAPDPSGPEGAPFAYALHVRHTLAMPPFEVHVWAHERATKEMIAREVFGDMIEGGIERARGARTAAETAARLEVLERVAEQAAGLMAGMTLRAGEGLAWDTVDGLREALDELRAVVRR